MTALDDWLTKGGLTRKQIVIAALTSGHRGTYILALILVGWQHLLPCPGCDYALSGCRCIGYSDYVENLNDL